MLFDDAAIAIIGDSFARTIEDRKYTVYACAICRTMFTWLSESIAIGGKI